jgi:hypothetical protein
MISGHGVCTSSGCVCRVHRGVWYTENGASCLQHLKLCLSRSHVCVSLVHSWWSLAIGGIASPVSFDIWYQSHVMDPSQESIAAQYRWWNHDRAIEYAMSMTKSGGKDETSSNTVIQWVIHEVGGGSSHPTITKTNYSNWALLMKVKLKARGLWAAMEPSGGDL